MAFLRGLLALPLIIGIVAFAISHTTKVSVTLNPFAPSIELPLYAVALAFLAVGFLLGSIIAWISMHKVRKEKRAYKKEIKKLEKDIEELEADLAKVNIKLSNKKSFKADIKELAPLEAVKKLS